MSWLDWLPWYNKDRKHYSYLRRELETFCPTLFPLTRDEEDVIGTIRKEIEWLNCNNVTRTMAYFDYFQRNKEIEWSLLAHMVSRNAGWNMTDLKGEWCSRLLTEKEGRDFFLFIERANWLIFQDAFPQLRLYEESKKRNKSLFHLLPLFHVSTFMNVMWKDFWEYKDTKRLTISLIINEQNYIEQRVVHQKHYASPVVKDIKFSMEDWLDLNLILFPGFRTEKEVMLYGRQVNSFLELGKRIQLGKDLYSILFSPVVLKEVISWCEATPHTGSRQDYWPEFFCSETKRNLEKPLQLRFDKSKGNKNVSRAYSPSLEQAWPDYVHEPAMIGDWFQNLDIVEELQFKEVKVKDVVEDYNHVIGKLERIVHMKEQMQKVFPVGET